MAVELCDACRGEARETCPLVDIWERNEKDRIRILADLDTDKPPDESPDAILLDDQFWALVDGRKRTFQWIKSIAKQRGCQRFPKKRPPLVR